MNVKLLAPMVLAAAPIVVVLSGAHGCSTQQDHDAGPVVRPVPALSLVDRIPPDLRYSDPPEDAKAQERFVKISVAGNAADVKSRMHGGMRGIQDFTMLGQMADLLDQGPVQLGLIPTESDSFHIPPPLASALAVTNLFAEGARQALSQNKRKEAVRLLKCAYKWGFDTGIVEGFPETNAVTHAQTLLTTDLLRGFTVEEKQEIVKVLPGNEYLFQRRRNWIKAVLEQTVRELEASWAPRTDLLIEGDGPFEGGLSTLRSWGDGPKPLAMAGSRWALRVPPHGTLDREATFQLLIETCRRVVKLDTPSDEFSKWLNEKTRWLPKRPAPLVSGTSEEARYRAKFAADYAEDMNSEKNSLGRELVLDFVDRCRSIRDDLPGRVLSLRAAADYPDPPARDSFRLTPPSRVRAF